MAEGLKWRVNRAVRQSTLPPPSRLIMLTLAERADSKTAVIPDEHTPSLPEIASETGLGEATVKRHLAALEKSGWVRRERPTAEQMARHVPSSYALAIGFGGSERAPETPEPGAQSEPSNEIPGAQSEPSNEIPGAQSEPSNEIPGAQSEPSNEIPGAQSEPVGGSERALAGAQSEPPSYISDRNHQNHLTSLPAEAGEESDGTLFSVAETTARESPAADPSARFAEFYKTYPRHVAPARAEKAWIKAVKSGAEPQVIIEAAWLFAIATKTKDTNYLPYPSTWLNDRGWENELEHMSGPRDGGHHSYQNTASDDDYAGDL